MDAHLQFSELLGRSQQQKAFYFELFKKLLKNGIVYANEVKGWNIKSLERWRSNLIKNEVLLSHRTSFGGPVYYELHPQFRANILKFLKLK